MPSPPNASIDKRIEDVWKAINDQTFLMQSLFAPSVNAALITFKASSATSIPLVLANPSRRGLIIVNTDANDLWLRYGPVATVGSGGWTYKIGSGVTWEMPQPIYNGRIDGIWTAAGAGIAEITEV